MQHNFQLALFALVFSFSFLLQTNDAEAQILINEVCSSNASLIADPDKGKYGDWIELLCTADDWIDLGDYYLTDDSSRLDKWKFPSKTYIGKNKIRFVFADGLGYKLHTNFKIEKKGEWLAIVDSTLNIVDSLTIPYLLNDMSYGRLPLDYNTFSVFQSPTPDAQNLGTSSERIASFVRFNISGGMYSGSQKLALSYPYEGNTIYYTLDGSYPTISSLVYNDTLELNKTSVIRAICFEAGTIPGLAVTQTYFIDEPQNLPIFSLVTDSVHLFSDETGIMVEGTAGVPGYCTNVPHNLNQDWERPVNLEFFEDDGTQVLNQECGAKIFGGCSRIRYPEKSLAFFARGGYETSSFSHQLFPDKHAVEYESFILRASGDDQPKTLFRDALTQTLVKGVIDVQGYRPVVLYINGDYWGIINMREKLNEHYVANNYDIDSDNVSVLRRNPESGWNTIAGSADHYNNMMAYIRGNDITKKTHYDYVSEQMDIDEYINYQIIQVFFGGRDWPGNNIKFWRSTEAPYDKWRWILYDLDAHSNDAVGNIMEEATELDCDCSWPNPPWSTYLFRSLLENEDFAGKFIERFNTYTNTHFARDRYYATINEMQNHLAAEIPRHIERWGGQRVYNPDNTWTPEVFNSYEEWDANIQEMRDFVGLRHEIAIQQLNDYFGIEGTRRLKLFNTDSTGSTLMLGNTPLYDSAFSGNYSTNTEIEISVVIDPGFKFTHWDRVSYTPIDSILILKGDEWKYYDEGQEPDGEWTRLDYDDTSWGTGFAELGYGDGDENTVVAYGPDPNNKYVTTYFRKAFSIHDTVNVETYELQIKRDDAAIVFLNGKQVVKENMPQYGHNYTTNAVAIVGGNNEDRYLIFNLNPELFVKGENIIAVEIHQAGAGSSDISFDLQLKATSMQPGDITEITSETVLLTMNDNYGLTAHVIPDKNVLENVFINEISASNIDRFADEAGDYEDWIEIYNIGDEAVNLAGYYLADSVPVTKKWMFPVEYESATTIPPDSFIVVFADDEPLEGPLHANFRLSGDGEEVVLLLIANEDTTIIDHVIFGKQYNNVSWGRYPDGAEEFQFMPMNTPWYSNFWEPLDTTSVTEMAGMQFALYPNPTKSVFYIDLGDLALPGEVGVRIYSFTGREVLRTYTDVSERIELSLEGHAPGLYLVELEISGQRLVRKLIVE